MLFDPRNKHMLDCSGCLYNSSCPLQGLGSNAFLIYLLISALYRSFACLLNFLTYFLPFFLLILPYLLGIELFL